MVRPLATGFLLVTARSTGGQQVVVQPALRLEAGTSVSIAIPGGSTTLTVEFSKPPTRDLANNLVSTESVTVQAAAQTISVEPPTVSKEASTVSKEKVGRVEEPLAGSESRVSITLAVPAE
jgi:hypothetical protein